MRRVEFRPIRLAVVVSSPARRDLAIRGSLSLPPEFNCRLVFDPLDTLPAPPSVCVLIAEGRDQGPIGLAWKVAAGVPCIAVGDVPKDIARLLGGRGVIETLLVEEIESRLSTIVRLAIKRTARERVCQIIRTSSSPSLKDRSVRDSLVASVYSARRFHSVQELAAVCYCDPSTLRRWWRAASLPGTPGVFLGWHLLLESALLLDSHVAVETTAARLGTSRSTLYRLAREYLGNSLANLTAEEGIAGFAAWIQRGAVTRGRTASAS